MNLIIQRQAAWSSDKSTMGSLCVNGLFYCYTLEPPMYRDGMVKPYAIPAGSYQVRLKESPHFTQLMAESESMRAIFEPLFPDGRVITPHLYGVPDFEEVEIHPGNGPCNTHACTLVGDSRMTDYLLDSDLAFRILMKRLFGANDPIIAAYISAL